MGMYTEFFIKCRIREDAPTTFSGALHDLIYDRGSIFDVTSEAIDQEKLRCAEADAFFSDPRFGFFANPGKRLFDAIMVWGFENGELSIGTGMKDYDGTIEAFWEWISPWIADAPGTIIGKCQCEEYDIPGDVVVGDGIDFGYWSTFPY